MGSHQHQHVGEALHLHPHECFRPTLPLVLQGAATRATNVDAIEAAGDGVEPRRINDDIEVEGTLGRAQSRRRDALDRRVLDVDEFDIGLVVDFEIPRFHGYAAGAEAVVLGDQLLGDFRIVHARADFARHEIADEGVGAVIRQHVAEIALPHGKSGRRIEPLQRRFALLVRDVENAARIGRVQEAGEGLLAALEHLGIVGLDLGLRVFVDLRVVQRLAPVGRALKDGQVAGRLGDLRNRLHAGCPRADDGDPLALERHRLVRPVGRVERRALECFHALDARHRRGGQRTNRCDEEARREASAVLQGHVPASGVLLVVRRRYSGATLDVAAQVELVGNGIEIAQSFGLGRKMLRPVPLRQQFW